METNNSKNLSTEAIKHHPSQEKRKENPSLEKLKKVLSRISQEINADVGQKYGLQQLVTDSLHIDPSFFSQEKGGIYEASEVTSDEETVYSLDRYNAAADNPSTQKFYKDQYGIENPDDIVAKHRESKESSKSNQAEMIITALMYKILKKRFLVVRSAIFDDYKHGIDNLIIDKETGAVICAFDEVLQNQSDKEKTPVKLEKIKKKALSGGTEAKYGLALHNGSLTRSRVRNIPIFYLALESKDITELTNDLFHSNQDIVTVLEEKLFSHLITSIREQKNMLEHLHLPPIIKRKLEHFETSLTTLETFIPSHS